MFLAVAWFEVRFWLRSWMFWGSCLLIGGLVLGATGSDEIAAGLGLSNIHRNAPFAIASYYAAIGVFTLLLTAMFVNSAALRDFSCNTDQLIFSTPVRRRDLLFGRFVGATLVSIAPMLGVSAAIVVARHMPWADAEQWDVVRWSAHARGILLFALPNTFLTAAVLFAAAVAWRREIAPFIAAILLVVGRTVGNRLFHDARYEHLRALTDPFGFRALAAVTKYWTVADKNGLSVDLTGALLWSRLLWIAVGVSVFTFAYARFSFAARRTPASTRGHDDEAIARPEAPECRPSITDRTWPQFVGSFAMHVRGLTGNAGFLVITVIAAAIVGLALVEEGTQFQSNETYKVFPVTYAIIELLRGTLNYFILIIIAYFAGVLVWKDRDERMDDILDATPAPEWVSYAARLATLIGVVLALQVAAAAGGVIFQAVHGYHRFQLGVYAYELLVRDASGFVFLAILAFAIQVVTPNKYVGYAAFLAVYGANTFLWPAMNVATNLVQFAARPAVIYSDFYGDAPFRASWNWFTAYWLLVCALLAIATVMYWPRGKRDTWKARRRHARLRFRPVWRAAAAMCLLALSACGGWIWYNAEILNAAPGPSDVQRLGAEYEKTYKPLATLPQPRVRSVRYAVDVFPSSRNMNIRGEEIIYNPYARPLAEVHFTLDRHYDTSIDLPGATLIKDDARLSYRVYRFAPPLEPGETRTLRFIVRSKNRGFENNVSNLQVVQNGTLVSNLGGLVTGANYLAPIIGYDHWRELTDLVERKKYGLKDVDLMRAPERNCADDCRDNFIPGHADWVDISATISTSSDQIAVAPGSLVREWRQGGRRYFEYALDHASMNLYCVASAQYEVAREQWKGIDLEVYHLAAHPWNVARMMTAMRKSLDYYTTNFGPYAHTQARIVEFPRVSAYAAEFPGTMPYSESFGFIADLTHADDLDNVFFVVAHEVAHQWWDDQVIGANMEGADLLSETLAQYSALMVMEKEYGRDAMRRFLQYEMDLYLTARGQERLKERPLLNVENRQFYIFYQKGAIALYQMKEMIGEDAVNRALRTLIRRYAYAPAPYPTSYALIDALRDETPVNLRYLIKDLFEDITLFSNRTLAATAVKRADGKYDVTINVEARKFKADATGAETEVPVDDWIDIGAFAKPDSGRRYGATLYRARMHIVQRASTFTFSVDRLPETAGIDPFALLIDRSPGDNMRKVAVATRTGGG
jgi:ABC-2 type transport system permease protein